jgi:hypothetical protein
VGDTAITASMLYNLVTCPKRVALDLFGNRERCDPIRRPGPSWSRGGYKRIERLDVPIFFFRQVDTALGLFEMPDGRILESLFQSFRNPGLLPRGMLCKHPVATDKESAVSLSVC